MNWIVFIFLILMAILVFVISKLNENAGGRAMFVALSGILLIVNGVLTWTSGLVLPIVESSSLSGTTTTFNYVTLSVVAGNDLFVIVNLITWLGAIVVLHSAIRVVADIKENTSQGAVDI